MREQLLAFANAYAAEMDNAGHGGDEMRNLNNPLVFLFIGDKATDALEAVHKLNMKKWNNSKGVVYLHVHQGRSVEGDNIYHLQLPGAERDKKLLRPSIAGFFYKDEKKLVELNVTLRRMNDRMAEFGRSYTSLQRLNIAVVTRVDDPCNVLIQELTVLMQSVFSEQFRSVIVDVYGLMQEKDVGEEFGLSASLGVSFLRELDQYQSRGYEFSAKLQVTGEGIKMDAVHPRGPLFDMAYLISDKNEESVFQAGAEQDNCEIICNLNLLKNRKAPNPINPKHGAYNNQQFRQNMAPSEGDSAYYASAGFSKVNRPNQAIALTVLHHFYQHVLERSRENCRQDKSAILELLGVQMTHLEHRTSSLLVPQEQAIEEMLGLMVETVRFKDLKPMTLRQAEKAMYGDNAKQFFDKNVGQTAELAMTELRFVEDLNRVIETKILDNSGYGYFAMAEWFKGNEKGGCIEEIHHWIRETVKTLEKLRGDLELLYEERVHFQPFTKLPFFFNKRNVKRFIHVFLTRVYGLKWEILFQELKLKLLKQTVDVLENAYDQAVPNVEQFYLAERTMRDAFRSSISETNEYMGRNISEYYDDVVKTILIDMEKTRDSRYYFEDRQLGNLSKLLSEGIGAVIQRFIDLARRDLFVHSLFHLPFEEEFLKRANVVAGYEEQGVLSKEELFRDLYKTLDGDAAIHLDVYRFNHQHRYIEKYFFGDFDSEFVQYSFEVDQGTRSYKLGCLHEKKQSGIEKLNLMGGFRVADTMFYRNGLKYYESYLNDGYKFHREEG
jgi:hypothetical protein